MLSICDVRLPVTVSMRLNAQQSEVKSWSQDWLIHVAAGAYPVFCSMKWLEVFLLPMDGMLVHHRSLPCNRPFHSCVLSYLAVNASEARGDLALIETSLLFSCKYQLVNIRTT